MAAKRSKLWDRTAKRQRTSLESVENEAAILAIAIASFTQKVSPVLALADKRTLKTLMDTIQAQVRVPICRVAKLIVPDIQQKIDEFIIADERGLVVNKETHGADAQDHDGGHVEIKASTCLKKNGFKCNVNWPLPKGATVALRRIKLLAKIDAKTGNGGYALIRMYNHMHVTMKDYKLCNAFLVGYFSHLTYGKCNNHNMGCTRCVSCKEWHRVEAYAEVSREMEEDGRVLSSNEWNTLVKRSFASQC